MRKLFARNRRAEPIAADPVPDSPRDESLLTLVELPSSEPTGPAPMRIARPAFRLQRYYEDPSLFGSEEKGAQGDRVISFLQITGRLRPGTLARARRTWRAAGRKDKLWRVLLRSGEISEDVLYEAAASAYGFPPIQVSLLETVGLIDHLAKDWPDSIMPRLIGLGIIPVVPEGLTRPGVTDFAAYDPTRPEVRRMVATASQGTHTIRYLSRSDLESCIQAVRDFIPGIMPATIRSLRSGPRPVDSPLRRVA